MFTCCTFFLVTFLQWRKVLQLPESHSKGVTCITGYMISQNDAIFASTSSDSSVIIWNADLPSTNEGKPPCFERRTLSNEMNLCNMSILTIDSMYDDYLNLINGQFDVICEHQ